MSANLDLVRGAYAALADGNIPALMDVLSPQVHWVEAEGGPYGGVSIGPDAVLQNVFMKIAEEWDGFAAVPIRFVEQGDTIVSLGEYSGTYKATGKPFRAPFAHVWDLHDGKIVAFQQHTDTAVHMRSLDSP